MKFMEACQAEKRLEALRLEAMEIAVWSGGNMNNIRDFWYGRQNRPGVRTKMMELLRDPTVADELKDRGAYHEVYEGLWAAISTGDGKP